MSKRILLVLAFGISFAPAVFADGSKRTGMESMNNTSPEGVVCDHNRLDRNMPSEASVSQEQKSGTAVRAE